MIRRTVRALLAAASLLLAAAPAAAARTVHLVILHTNDVHGHLEPFDYAGLRGVGGVARRSTLIRRLGAGRPDVLVVDAGDLWERGALSARYHGVPEVAAMNAAGYDLMTLGNNEFRAGIPNLLARQRQARFPMLSANVHWKRDGSPLVRESIVLHRAGLTLGIFGLTAPRIVTYPGLSELSVEDPIDAAHHMVRALRPRCDVIIALTHLGFPLDRVLAEEEPGIDVIVGGDSHTRLDRPYVVHPDRMPSKAIPIVQDGEYGVRQGRLDLWIDPARRGNPVVRAEGRLHLVDAAIPPDPRVVRVLRPYLNPAAAVPFRPVSRPSAPVP